MERGVKVRDCIIHGESGRLGCVSFRDIPDKFRWVLSLPQRGTIALLQQNLAEFPNVTLHSGMEVTGVQPLRGWRCRGLVPQDVRRHVATLERAMGGGL